MQEMEVRKLEENSKIGLLKSDKKFARVYSISEKNTSSLPVLGYKAFITDIPTEKIVEFMILDRRTNGQVVKNINIERVDPPGYDLKRIKEMMDIAYSLGKVEEKVINNLGNNLEEMTEFSALFFVIKNELEKFNIKNASEYLQIPLKYCSEKIVQEPYGKNKLLYTEVFSNLDKIQKKFTSWKTIDNFFKE